MATLLHWSWAAFFVNYVHWSIANKVMKVLTSINDDDYTLFVPSQRNHRQWKSQDCIRPFGRQGDYRRGRLKFCQLLLEQWRPLLYARVSTLQALGGLYDFNVINSVITTKIIMFNDVPGAHTPCGILLSMRIGDPDDAITSPWSLNVTIKLPRYLPNA